MILPLRMAVLQALFLVVAIAIESTVLHWNLDITHRKSIQYATFMNLLSIIFGWLIFFSLEPVLSPDIKQNLIRYVFFDYWPSRLNIVVIASAVLTFFFTYFIKFQGLELLRLLLQEQELKLPELPQTEVISNRAAIAQLTETRQQRRKEFVLRANATLAANGSSYFIISLILGARFIFQWWQDLGGNS